MSDPIKIKTFSVAEPFINSVLKALKFRLDFLKNDKENESSNINEILDLESLISAIELTPFTSYPQS